MDRGASYSTTSPAALWQWWQFLHAEFVRFRFHYFAQMRGNGSLQGFRSMCPNQLLHPLCSAMGGVLAALPLPFVQNVAVDHIRGEIGFLAEPLLGVGPVSYTHLRAHETRHDLVCRL